MPRTPIDIYPQSRTPELNLVEFQNPSAIFRGTPFWAWNNRLQIDQLKRQIDCLKEMGLGGYHMHSRSGLDTEYMSPEFLAAIKACVEYGKQVGMVSWLYDEDRWPSGFAGGLVTKDTQYRARHLLFTAKPYSGQAGTADGDSHSRGTRMENGQLLARYEVTLDDNGCLQSYRRLADNESVTEHSAPSTQHSVVWYAYLEIAGNSPWYNNQAYVDTLNPAAIRKFVEVTHEPYYQTLKEYFGKEVPAIFTDEPQFAHKQQFRTAHDTRDITLPWTDDFFGTYAAAYDQRLEDFLPELFWELPSSQPSLARYRYHDHVAERFAEAFADTVGHWCEKHGIALTGHMMEEPRLQSQTAAIGDCMRSYRSFQLPGIDMLCDWPEYTTAKQAQSAAHQYGRSGVLSELYGVTNWDFPFLGHKGQGDWQAALGVTVRVHHLAWVSMEGEAKRDYPASISYQSPWYKEYPLVEDHFARLNTVLTRGTPGVRVGVIHPVESYWLCFGPLEQTKMEREERDANFQNITNYLLFGLVDFDFICESLLPTQNRKQTGDKFAVGQMAYDVIVVPGMRTIRSSTLKRLAAFAKAGGKILFVGEIPSLVDAQPSDRAARLARKCTCVPFARTAILNALQDTRELEVRTSDGGLADSLLHQIRYDGDVRRVFICNTDRERGRGGCKIKLRGTWAVEAMDTFTGKVAPLAAQHENGWTVLAYDFPAHGHILLTYAPAQTSPAAPPARAKPAHYAEISRLSDPVAVSLSEPNCLLLDQAQWKLNDGPWEPLEEILRLENLVRAKLGLPPQTGHNAQPWTDREAKTTLGQVTLRFTIESAVEIAAPQLALEHAVERTIRLDGHAVPSEIVGYYVDESVQRVKLPAIAAGTHHLEVIIPYHRKTCIEWHYLLGDFGVQLAGRHARLTAPIRTLTFGDYAAQGLPFYTGNVTYHCQLNGTGKPVALQAPHFKVPLLSVDLDGKTVGKIAFAPFRVELGVVSEGTHKLDLTAFGHRHNNFGCVHWANARNWVGPNAWRTTGEEWAYEYQVKPMGVLIAPMVQTAD